MFSNLRLRIVLAHLGLSAIIYFMLIALSVTLFHNGLTSALDQELSEVTSEVLPVINIDSGRPTLGELPAKIQIKPIRRLACIALFDQEGKLTTHLGGVGLLTLHKKGGDLHGDNYQVRVLCSPLFDEHDKQVGYLQVELPTNFRENSTRQFQVALISTTPILLIAMALAGYFFSELAMRPIERSFALLRSFLQDANHELKTPVAITQATLENLQRDLEQSGTPHTERMEVLFRNVSRMERLTNDMLYLARAESGQFKIEHIELHIKNLIEHAERDFRPLYQAKSVELSIGKIPEASFMGGADDFERLLANLLSNALRYTPEGGKVTVTVNTRGRTIVLQVTDTGVGIPKESLPFVFERFYRVNTARARKTGGSGLGLAIVKAIVDSLNGTVEVKSEIDQGTTFIVTLPSC